MRRWGAGAVPLLASVINDGDVMVGARARAAYALRVFLTDPAALSQGHGTPEARGAGVHTVGAHETATTQHGPRQGGGLEAR